MVEVVAGHHAAGARTCSRPTLADVALRAAVSGQTVSRVVNGSTEVTAATTARVMRAIADLGYRPNTAARALKARRSNTIGIVTADTTLYGPTALLYSVESAVRQGGYFVSVVSVPVITAEQIRAATDRLRSQGVEGLLVLCTPAGPPVDLHTGEPDVPTVVVGQQPATATTTGFDDVAGAREMVAYLLGLGHATVRQVAGPADHPSSARRHEGWQAALAQVGAHEDPPAVGDWSAGSGYAAGRRLAAESRLTAVFCANDQMALGVLRALAEAGRAVPREVSVAGFDDAPESAYYHPPLSTVRQDFRELGAAAVRLLHARLSGDVPDAGQSLLHTQLVIRASTAAPPGGTT